MELRKAKQIYLDSNCLIYYFENNPKYAQKVEDIFNLSIQNSIKLITCNLSLMELLVLPVKLKNKRIIKLYKNLDKHIPNFTFVNVDEKTFVKAAEIRASTNFRSPDSIHLASSIVNKCDAFVTSDKQLQGFNQVKIQLI